MGNEIDQNVILQAILELSDQVKSVEERLTKRIDSVEEGLSGLSKRIDSVEEGLSGLSKRIDSVEEGLSGLSERINGVEERLTQRFDRLETNLSAKIKKLDEKVGVLSLELLETKADVSLLKKAE